MCKPYMDAMLIINLDIFVSICLAIKTGRYTHEKIAMNIKEVKGIVSSPVFKGPKTSPRQMKSFSPGSGGLQTPGSMEVDDSNSCNSSGGMSSVVPSPDLKRGGGDVLWFDESQTDYYDSVVKRFVEIHEAHFLNTKEFLDQLPAKENEFLVSLVINARSFIIYILDSGNAILLPCQVIVRSGY